MYIFLVNPASRSGQGQKYWERVKTVLDEKKIPYEVHFSKKSGDITRLAEQFTESLAEQEREVHIVALGGDGTANEAVQGIRDFERTRFSYIPTGSSNDLARDIGIGKDPLKALENILASKEAFLMDVGVIHYNTAYIPDGKSFRKIETPDRNFLVSCGIGFDAAVCAEVMVSSFKKIMNKLGLGKLTYLGIALKQLFAAGNAQAWLKVGEGNTATVSLHKLLFIACMSHRYEGGGFKFCPHADASDGILDLCSASDIPKWKLLRILPTAFAGNHFRFKGVDQYSGSYIHIRTSAPLWVHTDGETNALSDDIILTCRKRVLRFYY